MKDVIFIVEKPRANVLTPELRGTAVLARKAALLAGAKVREELGLRRVRKRRGGPDLRKAAVLALLYWEFTREVEWVGGGVLRKGAHGKD